MLCERGLIGPGHYCEMHTARPGPPASGRYQERLCPHRTGLTVPVSPCGGWGGIELEGDGRVCARCLVKHGVRGPSKRAATYENTPRGETCFVLPRRSPQDGVFQEQCFGSVSKIEPSYSYTDRRSLKLPLGHPPLPAFWPHIHVKHSSALPYRPTAFPGGFGRIYTTPQQLSGSIRVA